MINFGLAFANIVYGIAQNSIFNLIVGTFIIGQNVRTWADWWIENAQAVIDI